ncbi:tetratricopeptide repeat protein [Flavobacteriaceae bacterium]|nr:tetratricopeptide repeat protein [Flavobacteriaceae bacterium]MDA9015841.1 tetratricopeptide repeat protein [Flavobacteriaceae bacterium]MDB3862816.1 tetratricopeptide repeat protein [Flavobacteriaceae bacterium]MDC3354534.1 tetratricopeptide repeat protein [Flavobacteriaceae bacterium]
MLNYNSEETQSSITKFERMLKTNLIYFFDAQEFEDIIVHYLGFGENQLAKKALKMGLEQHPTSHELLLLQSEVFIIDEKYDAALKLLDYVEKLNPLDEEISLQKASIASKNGDHEASIKFLNKALELSEDPLEIWNLLGMEHLLAEEFEEASYFFKNCIKDNPQDYSALYNLLYSYDHLNKINESITVLNEVLEIDPYSEVAWHQLGLVLLKKEQHKEALSAFDFAIISDDTFTGAYIEKGKLLETMGRINEAIDNYEIALNTNDPSAFVFLSIGRCHETLDNSEIAVSFYLKAIHLEPSNENSWISLIEFYISLKQHKKAKDYFKRALEVNSESVELWKKGTQIYKALGQLEKALNAYQKLYDLGVYELPILLNHIDLHLQLKQWDKAFEMTNEAYKTFPESKSLAFRLGGCCMELGKKSEARYFLNVEQLSEEERLELSKLFPSFDQI